ncbi:GyrI-like domain-containing protein [Hymenobacter sp. BRD128]|uniref:GyrI-like domain-containing protein n=1 Tax=Hymenobacter sp. BRD128 TaxID=2675878 RepID=UPI0015672D3B|nr:GyrI-like domain-containing protein [Hymenobacter sp. BRD128]QKG58429.1 GyrI-like domain-containing protein [Hymenobacter sp. BRD128]
MRFFFPLVLIFTAIGLSIYAYLGGLRTPSAALETTAAPVLLAGQPFRGKVDDARFGELFREAKQRQDANHDLPLANLYYNDPESAHDSIRAFVGVRVPDSAAVLPTGWRYRVVPAGRRVVAARVRGVSFLLAPGKLYAAAQQAIKEQKLTKQPFYLEQFGADEVDELRVGVK